MAPQEKYEIWMQLVGGETTVGEAADRARVDRSTVAKLREVARQGALDALARSRPGRRDKQRDVELEAAQAEIERLCTALCSASEFDAEMVPRIEPTLAGSRVDLRGVSCERERSSSEAACAVAGGEVGDLLGGDFSGGYPGRGGPPPQCRCVHDSGGYPAATIEEGSAPPAVDHRGVTQLPEPVSPSYRNRVRDVQHTYRSQRVKHVPGQHTAGSRRTRHEL